VDLAVEELEAYPAADPSVIFDYVFEIPTWTIQEQKEKLLKSLGGVSR
jgi:2-oxoisovalerate dehydrogenase E1 component alpha subunit